MNFVNPWALGIGAASIGLPLVIHWLTKPRPVRMPLSTVRFVMEAVQQRRDKYRLRDWIILLLRAAAVALLAWAFARPLTDAKPLVPLAAPDGTSRVVLLDQSQSTAAVANGIVAFDRAKPVAARYLDGSSGLRANLILAAARPRAVFERLSTNTGAMRDELAAATVRPERLDLQAAINRAGEMLAADAKAQRRELVIVSDFQRANWAGVDFSPLPEGTLIQVESAAPRETPANVSIQRVSAAGRVEQGREVPVEVEVGNYSRAARTVNVELKLGGATYQLAALCPPGVRTTLVATVTPKEAGWQSGEARVLGGEDALKADDVRAFVLDVRRAPTYAMVTREPSAPRASSSHFLERALAPAVISNLKSQISSAPAERVIRLSPSNEGDKEKLAAADLIVLDHPGKLTPEWINLLAGTVRRGRGSLYVASEPIDATNLKLFADAAGADLKLPVKFLPPQAGQVRKNLSLASVTKDQPPFREFGEELPAAIGPLRFGGGLNTERDAGGLIDDVQATYGDGSACLVTTACGAGTVGVLNADLAASNLPASPAFVPMIGELVGRLLGRGASERAIASGERMDEYLPPEAGVAAGLSVAEAAAGVDVGAFADESNFVRWTWPSAGPPGVYAVKRGNATVFAVASAVPGVEGDLTPIDLSTLKNNLAGGRQVSVQSAASDDAGPHDSTWAWVLAACCGCLLMELLAFVGFRN